MTNVPPHEQLKNGNAFRFVKDYWFIIVFIFVAGGILSEIRGRVLANEITNQLQEQRISSISSDLNVLDKQYIKDVTYIKTVLEALSGQKDSELQSRLDELEQYFSKP